MEKTASLGTSIQDIVQPTFAIYDPLLRNNADKIRSVPSATFSYGSTPRQQLDVYKSPRPSIINGRTPVLIWIYGGGFVRGDKVMPYLADGLAHANLASFFALKFGYTVVVTDYRLVGTHETKFPGGGEDVALTVKWIRDHQDEVADGPIDLFAMGNSAGGVHLSTFMLHPSFEEVRRSVFSGTGCRLRGTILLSAPFDFTHMHAYRTPALMEYFGDLESSSPLGLLKAARAKGPLDLVRAGCRVFILNAERDPWDEIQSGRDKLIKEWMEMEGDEARNALAIDTMKGHNHISPCFGLSTGIEQEEAWGLQVAAFCDTLRRFPPS